MLAVSRARRAARRRARTALAHGARPLTAYPQHEETERLVLRQFRDSDLDVYASMVADPEVVRFLGGETAGRADAWRHLAMLAGHWSLRGFGMWAVELKQSGAFIGRVGLWFPEGWPHHEVGWVIAREHWGRGYASEAARPALHHARASLGLPHVISLITPGNERSIRVAEKLGGHLERRQEFRGRDTLVYGYDPPA